jgi:glucosyl-dolichyl phosphate glucuronosyltransferase
MTLSVIIATRDRHQLLDECLAHLARQPFAPGDEVIVVDNGSIDDTSAVIARHARGYRVPLRHFDERRPGKSHALAAALAVAKGDVLAFTDDDVNVEPSWLSAIRSAMADPTIALIGGPVAPRWERRAPAWLRPAADNYGKLTAPLALLNYGADAIALGPRTVLGANLAVRRDVFARVGGFATSLGKLQGTGLSGEDDELCRRVQAAGFRALYCPDARVGHWVPAERMRVRYYLWWFFWSGITNATLDAATSRSGRSLLGVPLYLVKRAATAAVGALATAVAGNGTGAIERATDVAFAAGYAARRWDLACSRRGAPSEGGGR